MLKNKRLRLELRGEFMLQNKRLCVGENIIETVLSAVGASCNRIAVCVVGGGGR